MVLSILMLCVSYASARIDGEAEWGYAHYERSSDNNNDLEASHFTQRYSLLYSTSSKLADGRAGFYEVGIGAEWGAFETSFGETEINKEALKYLYEGRLQIAPGALPFRLNAYSYDMQRIRFNKSYGVEAIDSMLALNPYRLIDPQIVTDLYNGQTIVSGFQLMAGIRNGTYLGKYREVLSKWPRLLVDYRDVYHRDMKSDDQQHYRDRDLAFVSLNKKDNWFHYRISTHNDYLDPINNTEEKVILLGTVDHTLKRQWINLTNWIRISVDGSYTETERNWDPWATERFDVNFFATMYRRDFSASSFTNMQRIKRGSRLEHILDVPVYLNQTIDADTSVRSTIQLWRQDESRLGIEGERGEEALYAKVLFETHKRSRVLVNPSLEMEVHRGDKGEGEALRGKVEVFSNRLRRQPLNWYGMSALAVFDGNTETKDQVDVWEGELQGSVTYRLTEKTLLGAEQYLLYGDGTHGDQATRFMRSMTSQGFDRDGSYGVKTTGTLLRTKSTLYLEHASSAKMTNRLQLFYKYQDNDSQRLDSFELSHRLKYQSRWWRAALEHFYVVGDDSDYQSRTIGTLGSGFYSRPFREQFFQRGMVEFRPNNYWMSRLESNVTWGKLSTGERDLLIQLKQKVERTFYSASTLRRKRGDISETLIFEKFKDGIEKRAMIFSLAGNYYPTTYWRLGASAHYYDYDYQPNHYSFSLTTGLDFPRFKVDFSYTYAAAEFEDTVANRYEVNVKKTF